MPLLSISNLSRHFGGLRAVDGVSFGVEEHSITGVIGPNGAGKTTLFNVVAGSLRPTAGTITFNGKTTQGLQPHRIAERGILRTFQNLKLFPNMSVLENVMVGMHTRTRTSMASAMLAAPWTRSEEGRCRKRAIELLDMMEIGSLSSNDAANLSYGQLRCVELARALAAEPKLLLLDEPAAGLNIQETDRLAATIRLIRSNGVTVLLVEHDMSLVMNICDAVVVLSFGRKIAEGTPREVQANNEVVRVYLGDADA